MLKIMAIGDIHLGRTPGLRSESVDPAALGPSVALKRAVDAAIARGVQAVLFAGDVVEGEQDFFEGLIELKQATERLLEAGIRVIAVAGNHDVEVLPRLAELVRGVELLGRGGRWERTEVEHGTDRAVVWGWSFPDFHYERNPLEGQRFPPEPFVSIGLLHAEVTSSRSRYAPVSRADLAGTGMNAWLLGHVHVPGDLSAENTIGYLGSLSPLDTTETGMHGPCVLQIESGRISTVERLVLGPLLVLDIALDITGVEEIGRIKNLLVKEIEERDARLEPARGCDVTAAVRLRLVGRSDMGRHAAESLHGLVGDRLFSGRCSWILESVDDDTRPAVPLEQLARQPDLAGALANHLIELDQWVAGGMQAGSMPAWLKRLKEKERWFRSQQYRAVADVVEEDADTDTGFAELVRRAAADLLCRLVDSSRSGR